MKHSVLLCLALGCGRYSPDRSPDSCLRGAIPIAVDEEPAPGQPTALDLLAPYQEAEVYADGVVGAPRWTLSVDTASAEATWFDGQSQSRCSGYEHLRVTAPFTLTTDGGSVSGEMYKDGVDDTWSALPFDGGAATGPLKAWIEDEVAAAGLSTSGPLVSFLAGFDDPGELSVTAYFDTPDAEQQQVGPNEVPSFSGPVVIVPVQ